LTARGPRAGVEKGPDGFIRGQEGERPMWKPRFVRRSLRRGLTGLRDLVDDRLEHIEEKREALREEETRVQVRPERRAAARRRVRPEGAPEAR